MQPPVIFFIGPPQHGKTESRKLACEITGLEGASCSDVIHAFIAARLKMSVQDWRNIPREERRQAEIEAGDFLCGSIGKLSTVALDGTVDGEFFRIPSGIIRVLFHRGIRVIDGVRRNLELDQARAHLEWLGIRSIVIWVERPGHATIADNTELTAAQADEKIVNDGDLQALRASVRAVLEKYQPPKEEKKAPSIYLGAKKPEPGKLFTGRA